MNRLIGILFLLITVASCGGGVSGGSAAAPSTPSSVPVAIEFLDGAEGVATDADFTRTYEETLDADTVSESTFFVVMVSGDASISAPVSKAVSFSKVFDASVCNADNALAATVTLSEDLLTMSLTLDADLEAGTSYTICVVNVVYASGESVEPEAYSFITAVLAAAADTGAPSVNSISLSADETQLSIAFSETMNAASAANITITADGAAASCSLQWSSATLICTTTSNWQCKTVVATVPVSVTDAAGNALSIASSATFNVSCPAGGADTAAPSVSSIKSSGTDENNLVSDQGDQVQVVFDEAIKESTIGNMTVTSTNYGVTVSGSWALNGAKTTATFTPNWTLHWDTLTVAVPTSVTDEAGNAVTYTTDTVPVIKYTEAFDYSSLTAGSGGFVTYWTIHKDKETFQDSWLSFDADGINFSQDTNSDRIGTSATGAGGTYLYYWYPKVTFTDTSVSMTAKLNDVANFNRFATGYRDEILIGFMDASDSTKIFWAGIASVDGVANAYGVVADNGIDGHIGLVGVGAPTSFDIWIKVERSSDTFAATYKTTEAGAWTNFSGGGVTTTGIGSSYRIVMGVYTWPDGTPSSFTFNTNSLVIDWDP